MEKLRLPSKITAKQKVGFAEKKLRLWGIEGGSVANGKGQVGALAGAELCLNS